MAKGGFRGMPGGMNQAAMMKQAQKMQQEMLRMQEEMPLGFWTDLAGELRKELNPPASGFFVTTANSPIQAKLNGQQLQLICGATFIMEVISKPEILNLVSQKASAKLGKPIRAVAIDRTKSAQKSETMEKLLEFGRSHQDIVNIKDYE